MYPALVADDKIKAEMHSLLRSEGRRSPYDAGSKGTVKRKDPFAIRKEFLK
jgi:hypothetical protein